MTDVWEQDLAAAFSVLLGRPVDEFDPEATYAVYYVNRAVDEQWVCLAADWGLDLARSVFEFEFTGESALAQAFGARPDSTSIAESCRTVTGDELAAVLVKHGLGLAEVVSGLQDGTFTVGVSFRVVTDGTLRDAVLTAIRGKHGPDRLRPGQDERAVLSLPPGMFEDEEDLPPVLAAERDRLLAPVRDPRLRAHIWSPYLDRPWDRPGISSGGPDLPGITRVAAWDLAYFGDVRLAVMRTEVASSGR